MNYLQCKDYLKKISKSGSILGLESIKCLLKKLKNPEKELKVIHIAGTNGKGSVSAFLQNILIDSGYKVGRYSSPAVFHEREVLTINGKMVSENQVCKYIEIVKNACDEMASEGKSQPTIFEAMTAAAFLFLKNEKCDACIIECGMGGKEDATNVFEQNLLSIITSISLDHTRFLGDTLEKIATVKAGIIKENCPVVVSNQDESVISVIKEIVSKKNSKVHIGGKPNNIAIKNMKSCFEYTVEDMVFNLELEALGSYQITNAITAIEAAIVLEKEGFCLNNNIEKSINKTIWKGRMEIINRNPLVVIDGAHNPGGVLELAKTIDLYFTNKRITFIMGVLADKDFNKELEIIGPKGVKFITVTPNNERALNGKELAMTIRKYNSNVVSANSIKEAYEMAMNTIGKEADMIIAFGSLSYLGELITNS